ncbi:MAG: hypothetical protein GY778_07420, partial [bacterium]|nr:hypothetical protein [bacterium]
AGLAFVKLLAGKPNPTQRAAMRAIIESLPVEKVHPKVYIDAALRFRREVGRMDRVRDKVYATLLTEHRPVGSRQADGSWRFTDPLFQVLGRAGWKGKKRLTPWRKAMDWDYAQRLAKEFTFDNMAPRIADERLDRLARRLRDHGAKADTGLMEKNVIKKLVARGKVARYMVVDPWGTEVLIT